MKDSKKLAVPGVSCAFAARSAWLAGVPNAKQGAGQQRDNDRDHGALQVDPVAHMRSTLGFAAGRIEECVRRFEEGVEPF